MRQSVEAKLFTLSFFFLLSCACVPEGGSKGDLRCVNQHRCGRFGATRVPGRAAGWIGIYGTASLQEMNQISNKEGLDFAVVHLHLWKARAQTR